jgi:hypothetical protein
VFVVNFPFEKSIRPTRVKAALVYALAIEQMVCDEMMFLRVKLTSCDNYGKAKIRQDIVAIIKKPHKGK